MVLSPLRRIVLLLLALGLTVTGGELLLLGHTEEWRQWLPIGLVAIALLAIGWHALDRRRVSLRAMQVTMVLLIPAALVGLLWHYQGNVEWQLESNPGLAGMALFREAMTGALPALAPAAIIQLSLLGLAYGFRHPLLRSGPPDNPGTE